MKKNNIIFALLFVPFITFGNSIPQQQQPVNSGSIAPPSASEKNSDSKTVENKGNQTKQNAEKEETLSALKYYNLGVKAQEENNQKEAEKNYTKAINRALADKEIRSKAFQNLGVIVHKAAKAIIMQKPEESLKVMDKAEVLYKEAMRYAPNNKGVAVNQQILINDKKLAHKIIKMRQELEKRRKDARNKTKVAWDKQKDTNHAGDKIKKNQLQNEAVQKRQDAQKAMSEYLRSAKENQSKKDIDIASKASGDLKEAESYQNQLNAEQAEEYLKKAYERFPKPKPQQNQNKQNNKQQNKQNKQNKNNQQKNNKQNNQQNKNNKKNDQQSKQDQNKKNEQQQKKNQARKDVQNALNKQQQANNEQNPQEKQRKQNEAQKETQKAQKSMSDYKNQTQKNNDKNEHKKAEQAQQDLKNASDAQKNNKPEKAEEDLKKALKSLGKPGDDKKQDDKKKDKQNQQPNKPQNQQGQAQQPKPQPGKKNIDPKQAEALLKMMAKEEKSLRDKLKDNQRKAYGVAPVDKDW